MKKKYKGIVIHHTESEFGNAQWIEDIHKEKEFDDIGYHVVICNEQIEKGRFVPFMDGQIEVGRDWDLNGAHTLGYNDYFGVCLVGVEHFTTKQFDALLSVCKYMIKEHGVKVENIIGHREIEGVTKSCPGFEVEEVRHLLMAELEAWNG